MVHSKAAVDRGAKPATNALAVISLVFALLSCFPLGIALGHLAKRQLRRKGQRGDLAASFAIALGYLYVVGLLGIALLLLIGLVSAWLNAPAR